jgi:hypothetical protein
MKKPLIEGLFVFFSPHDISPVIFHRKRNIHHILLIVYSLLHKLVYLHNYTKVNRLVLDFCSHIHCKSPLPSVKLTSTIPDLNWQIGKSTAAGKPEISQNESRPGRSSARNYQSCKPGRETIGRQLPGIHPLVLWLRRYSTSLGTAGNSFPFQAWKPPSSRLRFLNPIFSSF